MLEQSNVNTEGSLNVWYKGESYQAVGTFMFRFEQIK